MSHLNGNCGEKYCQPKSTYWFFFPLLPFGHLGGCNMLSTSLPRTRGTRLTVASWPLSHVWKEKDFDGENERKQ